MSGRAAAVAIAIALAGLQVIAVPASAQKLAACARGGLAACYELLNRPRLDPGRRAAIELHLAEMQSMSEACKRGAAVDCATLAERYPDLPPEILTGPAKTPSSTKP